MPKSAPKRRLARKDGYLEWTRDPAVGLFSVLPLWVCYEWLRFLLAPNERNGAEALISDVARLIGPTAFTGLRFLFMVAVVISAMLLVRRRVPWLRVTLVTALEGTVYALVLGPVAAALAASSQRLLQVASEEPSRTLMQNIVGSIGAGIFEEVVFRLVLMSVLALLLVRAASAFGLPKVAGIAAAVLLSSVVFSLFHHLGPSAPLFSQQQFMFRTFAGIVLGVMFAVRGIGVCVYAHAMYDVHYYLTAG